MTKRYKIKYYYGEGSYKIDAPAFIEIITGDHLTAVHVAKVHLMNNPRFKCYEIVEL